MSSLTGLLIFIGAIMLNVAWVIFEKRIDARPVSPNFHPDHGVDIKALLPSRDIYDRFGVVSTVPYIPSIKLPAEIKRFFQDYQRLRIDCVLELDRIFLEHPYQENSRFIKIGLMNEEDDLLISKSENNENIYIVCSEDGDPNVPELFATSFRNLLDIAWHDYNRIEKNPVQESNGTDSSDFRGRALNCFMASIGGILVLFVDITPLCVSIWFVISSCFSGESHSGSGAITLGVVSTMIFGLIAMLAVRSIFRSLKGRGVNAANTRRFRPFPET